MDFMKFQRLLNKSKSYTFEGSVLTITDYYTGEEVRLDLSMMDEENYNAMLQEDTEE